MNQERIPPHDQAAELAVLGAILLEGEAIFAVEAIVRAEMFYRADHQKLFRAYAGLARKAEPIDVVSTKAELRASGEADLAANNDLFLSLGSAVPSIANAEHYAGIVRDAYVKRSIVAAAGVGVDNAFDPAVDSATALDRAQTAMLDIELAKTGREPVGINAAIGDVVTKAVDSPESFLGLSTGFGLFDAMTSGLHRGELVIIGGRPSNGKTTFALNIMENLAFIGGKRVLFFSVEVPTEQVSIKLLCERAGVDSSSFRRGRMAQADWNNIKVAARDLAELGDAITIDDSSTLTPPALRRTVRRLFADRPFDVIVVDYLQLMTADVGRKSSGRVDEVSDISRACKALAKDFDVPVVVLSQLSRAGANERPRLNHLRDSGAIEQDADVVAFLHRGEGDGPEPDGRFRTELIIAKQRNGPTGSINLLFDRRAGRFTEDRDPLDSDRPWDSTHESYLDGDEDDAEVSSAYY